MPDPRTLRQKLSDLANHDRTPPTEAAAARAMLQRQPEPPPEPPTTPDGFPEEFGGTWVSTGPANPSQFGTIRRWERQPRSTRDTDLDGM